MWVKQSYTIPQITIFIGGINHSQSWVVYGIVFPTLWAMATWLPLCPLGQGEDCCGTCPSTALYHLDQAAGLVPRRQRFVKVSI